MRFHALLALAFSFALSSQSIWAKPSRSKWDDYVRLDAISNVQLSPDGERLAYVSTDEEDKGTLLIFDYRSGETSGIGSKSADIQGYQWLSDDKVLVSNDGIGAFANIYTISDQKVKAVLSSLENFTTLGFLHDGSARAYAYFFPSQRAGSGLKTGLALLDMERRDIKMIGVKFAQRQVLRWLELPDGKFLSGQSDTTGQLRAVTMLVDGHARAFHRLNDDTPWEPIKVPFKQFQVCGFSLDQKSIYLNATDKSLPHGGFYTYDITADKIGDPIYVDPVYSVEAGRPILDPTTGELLGLNYNREAYETTPMNERLRAITDRIRAALPGWFISVYSQDAVGRRMVFKATNSQLPSSYLVYDLHTDQIQGLPATRPWASATPDSTTGIFRWKARDGLELSGYVTLPRNRSGTGSLPTVVLAHGGPWSRDRLEYDPQVQLLVAQGYAIFQPNFRGSSGFSWEVSEKDAYDFRKMHNDVTDGVLALVNSGVADQERLAIMGASFGGFLAVSGAAWEPDLYQCAITKMGVFDWGKSIIYDTWKGNDYRVALFTRELGDPKKEAGKYREISPIHDIANVQIPIYISHGKFDGNVDADQSRDLIKALKKEDKIYESFFAELEGHGYAKKKNRIRYYDEVIDFLAKNLK